MHIYAILTSKACNIHYIKRYYKLIIYFSQLNLEKGERHHICPKALFSQYESFELHPWNKVVVPPRVHFILHWCLHKAYGRSQTYAFWGMINKLSPNRVNERRIPPRSSLFYQYARTEISERMKIDNPMHRAEVIAKKSGDKHHTKTKPWTIVAPTKTAEQHQAQSERMKDNNPMNDPIAKAKRSAKIKGRPMKKVPCPVCDRLVGQGPGLKSHMKTHRESTLQ